MAKERVSVNQHAIIQVIKVKEPFNYSLPEKEFVAISISQPFEQWYRHTYASKEIIYPEREAFFLPKASPLTVLTY